MFRNYFIVALRNFRHNKVFSLINILGLSVGISAALVIYLVVQYDFSFDRFHRDRDRIYRVVSDFSFSGVAIHNPGVAAPIGPTMQQEVTGLQNTAPFHEYNATVNITVAGRQHPDIFKDQPNIIFADNNYFDIIRYHWLAGSPELLKAPFQTVLTESRAKIWFANTNPAELIGRTILFDDSIKTTIAGVVKDITRNSDFKKFETFVSLSTIPATGLKNDMSWSEWDNTSSSSQLLVKLTPGTKPETIEAQLATLYKKYNKDIYPGTTTAHSLQPLADIHFNTTYGNFSQRMASKPALYGLLAVAAFLLLLGCINFVNLATAQATRRAKEIGVRKTMGSSKTQLKLQFFTETVLITVISAIVSLLLIPVLLQVFSDFIPPELNFRPFQQPHILVFLGAMVVVVSLLAGFYPALVLSRYKPALVLKSQAGTRSGHTRRTWLRKTLTVSQFVIAQFFIMATLVVGKQISYVMNRDMGFHKEAILYFNIPFREADKDGKNLLLHKLQAIPEINMISLGNMPPSSFSVSSTTLKYTDGEKETETHVQIKRGDTNYLSLYHIRLLAGAGLQQSDTTKEYLINETYARTLGFANPADAVGIVLGEKKIPVTGVVADFNTKSLHTAVEPVIVTCAGQNHNTFHIAMKPRQPGSDNWSAAIAGMEKAWKEVYPEATFEYKFFDESIENFYTSEQKTARLLNWSAGLAIFISCLGLLGLVIYTTHIRTKEIGIRKVLGASVSQVVALLSRDFIRLVIVAFIIAAPIAWWAMNNWLQDFAYRTAISWWLFLVSGALMIVAAIITLSIRTIRAASANPVESLRTE